jgi:hypothetical protein
VQGFTVQQPKDDTLAIHDHALVPTGRLDTLYDLTDTVVEATHRNIAPNDLPNRGYAGTCPLAWQTMGEPICLTGHIIEDPRETQTFKPRRGPGTEVSLPVIAVDNDRLVLPKRGCGLTIELWQRDIDGPG